MNIIYIYIHWHMHVSNLFPLNCFPRVEKKHPVIGWAWLISHRQPYLVGSWPTPLKNMSSSLGMMKFPIYGKVKNVPNHQPDINCWIWEYLTYIFIMFRQVPCQETPGGELPSGQPAPRISAVHSAPLLSGQSYMISSPLSKGKVM